jgi:glycerophosphoryl diester phosphodiesterase
MTQATPPTLPDMFLKAPIAHRAFHDVTDGRPENSRAAVKAAIDNGYGIEIDLQLSKDGQAMVFHDYDLDRLAEATGYVRLHTAAELREIPLKGGDETIPTLPEILELVAGRVPLLIELKDQDLNMGPNIGPLEDATAAALQNYDGPVALMSFNPHSVHRMAQLCPDLPRGITSSSFESAAWNILSPDVRERLRHVPDYDWAQASFISHGAGDLDNPRVTELKSQGANILCWTIKSPEAEAKARRIAQNVTFEGYAAKIPA